MRVHGIPLCGYTRLLIILSTVLRCEAQAPVLVWPLDNTTYTQEVLQSQNDPIDSKYCLLQFGNPPTGYTNDVIKLDGNQPPVDLAVTASLVSVDYSFSIKIKPEIDTGALMHYKSNDQSKPFREMLLYMDGGNLIMQRVLSTVTETSIPFATSITVNTWYFITFGIDISNGKMFVYVGVTKFDRDENFVDNISIELPGTLRIGGTFDQSQPNITGSVACVGFFTVKQPLSTVIEPMCQAGGFSINVSSCDSTPLISRTDTTKSHYIKETGTQLSVLHQIESSTKCTQLRCALSCLLHSGCWYYRYDTSVTGCKPCLLFDSTVTSWRGTGPADQYLFKWRGW